MLRIVKVFFSFFACLLVVQSFAVTQGGLGSESVGKVNVSLKIPAKIQISHLNDIVLNVPTDQTKSIMGGTSACVYTNAKSYSVKITGFGTVDGTDMPILPFGGDNSKGIGLFVQWYTKGNPSDAEVGTPIVPSKKFTIAGIQGVSTDAACTASGGANAYLRIRIDPRFYTTKQAGNYVADLTLTVSPD